MRDPACGVLGTERTAYIGVLGLAGLLCAPLGFWHGVLVFSFLLSLGVHTPLYRWMNPVLFRSPCRWLYFVGVAGTLLAVQGWESFPKALLLLHLADLCLHCPKFWPMEPYTERWERPSRAFNTPLTRYLEGNKTRVSGLPFPLRNGCLNQVFTPGYTGGFRPSWVDRQRGITDPDGTSSNDLVAEGHPKTLLNKWGVGYAYSYRPLEKLGWYKTSVPHLYQNSVPIRHVPTWEELSRA